MDAGSYGDRRRFGGECRATFVLIELSLKYNNGTHRRAVCPLCSGSFFEDLGKQRVDDHTQQDHGKAHQHSR